MQCQKCHINEASRWACLELGMYRLDEDGEPLWGHGDDFDVGEPLKLCDDCYFAIDLDDVKPLSLDDIKSSR
jgi:hypothetical protein